jgi:festuclavine dehydrogenase
MAVLLTGGRGKTASRLASLLNEAKIPFVVASRSKDASSPYQQVRFDWSNESTFDKVFEVTPIKAVYLLPPASGDMVEKAIKFIDVGKAHGVKRFVTMSSSAQPPGSPMHGQIHDYVMKAGVEWAVLRPSWFMGMWMLS